MKRAGAGFTLVELLLALTLMSMLFALAYGGLRAATRAADKGQAVLEDSTRIRMAHQFVRNQLNQMMPMAFLESEDESERILFEGDESTIRFVAPMPGYLGFGGPQVQELALVDGDDGLQLVLNHALLQGFEEDHLYERDPIVLLDRIEDGAFAFLARDEETEELTGWSSRWETPEVVPESVALEIRFDEQIYLEWPMLNSAVRVDARAFLRGTRGANRGQDYSDAIRDMIHKRRNQ